ncbi:MAG: Wzt carbohydrate-binding domain-containing protein [Acidobacteria bacterium]|nr:Wzt carbohydrate-binding domain-containing protein [Acidobacteriota bacterium]
MKLHHKRFGSLELVPNNVRVLDGYKQPTAALHDDSPLTVEMSYSAADAVRSPIFGVTIVNEAGQVCYETTSERSAEIDEARSTGVVAVRIDDLALMDGKYFVDVGAYERAWAYGYDYHAKAYPLVVHRNGKGTMRGSPQTARAIWSVRSRAHGTDATLQST